LAGLQPVAVLAEVMNEDGSMARVPDLLKIAEKLEFKVITIADLIKYRRHTERLVKRVAATKLPTRQFGTFKVYAYQASVEPHQARAPRIRRRRPDHGRARAQETSIHDQ